MPNSVLVRSMITAKSDALPSGKSLVGLSLKEGQYPDGLKAGDTVAAYLVGTDAKASDSGSTSGTGTSSGGGTGLTTPISSHLVIQSVTGSSTSLGGSGNNDVTVLADDSDASALTIAASANEVALVLVPNKN